MDLEQLKKGWNALDRTLQDHELVDSEQIHALIAQYRSGARRGLNWLTRLQKISLAIGIVAAIALLIILIWCTGGFTDVHFTLQQAVMGGFLALSLICGFAWDWRTYTLSRSIRIDETPIVEVVRMMARYRQKVRVEMAIVGVWTVLFIALFYWVQGYHHEPLLVQVVFLSFTLLVVLLVMWVLYKKLIYKQLNEVDRNLKELEELEATKGG